MEAQSVKNDENKGGMPIGKIWNELPARGEGKFSTLTMISSSQENQIINTDVFPVLGQLTTHIQRDVAELSPPTICKS